MPAGPFGTLVNPCVLVNPNYPQSRKSWFGIGPDPLTAVLVPARLRQTAWWITGVTFVAMLLWGASLPENPDVLPDILAIPLSAAFLAGLFAPKLVKGIIARERRTALRRIDSPHDLVQSLEEMRRGAVRFRDMAASQPRTTKLAHQTAQSLAWLLWHTVDRLDQIAMLERELDAAGSHAIGPAKQAWFRDRQQRIDELRTPIHTAVDRVRSLADLAEDTVWAARLATEKHPTIEIAAPTAKEIGAGDDTEEAVAALSSWHAAWTLLDERLRVLTERMRTDKDRD